MVETGHLLSSRSGTQCPHTGFLSFALGEAYLASSRAIRLLLKLSRQLEPISSAERQWILETLLEEDPEERSRRLHRERQARFRARDGDGSGDAQVTLPVTLERHERDASGDAHVTLERHVVPLELPSSHRSNNLELPVSKEVDLENLEPESARARPKHVDSGAKNDVETGVKTALNNDNKSLRGCVPGTHITMGLWEETLGWLDQCPTFRASKRLHHPAFWEAEFAVAIDFDYETETKKAQAWILANPRRAPKSDYARFLHSWFARAQEQRGDGNG